MEQQGTWKDIMQILDYVNKKAGKDARQGADAQHVYDTFQPKDYMTVLLETAGISMGENKLQAGVDAAGAVLDHHAAVEPGAVLGIGQLRVVGMDGVGVVGGN